MLLHLVEMLIMPSSPDPPTHSNKNACFHVSLETNLSTAVGGCTCVEC